MIYYHGTRQNNLKFLDPEKSVDGYAYLTSNLIYAIYFGGAPLTNWDLNKETKKLYIREICKDYLKILYYGVKEFIYVNDGEITNFEKWDFRGRNSIRTRDNVKVKKFLTTNNVYKKLIDLRDEGKIEIEFWQDMDKDTQNSIYEQNKEALCADIQKTKNEYPELYEVLVKIFPDRKV